jgi:2-phospho-L-lactate/phosphoenolpyruvate guanylyltransferase
MSVVAVLPVKRFHDAKARLGQDGLRPGERRALVTGMLTDVLESLRRADYVDDVIVVTGEPGAEVLARGFGAQAIQDDPAEGHNEAAQRGIDWALEQGAFHALLLAGDTPALDPADVDGLLDPLPEGADVVIVPDRHGTGTNALLLTPPDVIRPSFGEGSRARHEELARAAGATVRIVEAPSLLLDVDTGADLDALAAALEGRPKRESFYTREVLTRLRRR